MALIPTPTEPFTEYKLWVKAFTWKNEGESSDTLEIKTDVVRIHIL
jgi:receptor-type tyrosine-protein phosphatase gamma